MTQEKFDQICLLIGQLDFVDKVSVPQNVSLVFVELAPRVASLLPTNLGYLWVSLDSLTVTKVITRYEHHLQNLQKHGFDQAYQVGYELLQAAKGQAGLG